MIQIASALLLLTVGTVAWGAQSDVKRGEYLTRAGECISCHSDDTGDSYAGGLPMNTPFGIIYSPNITPDKETGIGTMTEDEFYRVLHEGVGQHGEYLYPVMISFEISAGACTISPMRSLTETTSRERKTWTSSSRR